VDVKLIRTLISSSKPSAALSDDDARHARARDEARLVARARAGDQHAFGEIFAEYYPRLVAFARAALKDGRVEVAEETVQDVFLEIWSRRKTWTIERSLAAYLFRAVRNRISSERRTLRLEQGYAATIVREIDPATTAKADDHLDEAELEAALAGALAVLPERARQVFLLNRREHLSYAEIGVVLGIAVKTVEMHMARALKALRASLADWRRD
jgi:RNA polymerase sigma-70 factor (ECF subfamily)